MPIVPEITGIGEEINPAIVFAKAVAVNIEREIHFPGETLTLFEMTPAGETELLELETDWTARRKDNNKDFPDHPFEFEICEQDALTDAIKLKAMLVKIGTKVFKIKPPQSALGNLGVWKFRAQRV